MTPAFDRIIPAIGLAATFMGAAFVTLGQAVFDPLAQAAERITGGTVLIVAATLIVRWTFQLWRETREAAKTEREASLERDRLHLQQVAELNAQLAAERQLRLSLEHAGIADRRDPATTDPTMGFIEEE